MQLAWYFIRTDEDVVIAKAVFRILDATQTTQSKKIP